MLSHISQMMVQRLNKQMKGEDDVDNIDILGNTTESAIQATKQALYDLDHPKEYVPKSIEVQRACMKEREILCCVSGKIRKVIIHKQKRCRDVYYQQLYISASFYFEHSNSNTLNLK